MTGAGGCAFGALYAPESPVSMSMLLPDDLSDSDREALNQTGVNSWNLFLNPTPNG